MVGEGREGGGLGCIGLQSIDQSREGHTSTHNQTGGCHLVQDTKGGGDGGWGGRYTLVQGGRNHHIYLSLYTVKLWAGFRPPPSRQSKLHIKEQHFTHNQIH